MKWTKPQYLFVFLTGIFLTNALLAEFVGVKIFSAEKLLNIPPANWQLLDDWVLSFNLTAGVILWPVVFVTTDLINEYFGPKGVKHISYLTIGCIGMAFLLVWVITLLPPANFWLEVNDTDNQGRPFNIDFAFNKIFLQGLGIIIGSMIAFFIGQVLDAYVFMGIKKMTGDGKLWLRATGSTLISQFVDSFVVLFVAFYFLAPEKYQWSASQVVSVGFINYVYKFTVAILLTPLIYLAHHLIDRYLGNQAEKVKAQAMN